MKYLKPTVRVRRRNGALPDVLITFLEVRNKSDPNGPVDECLIQVLGTNFTPTWVSAAALRPIMADAEMLD